MQNESQPSELQLGRELRRVQSMHDKFPKLANFEANPWRACAEHYAASLLNGLEAMAEILLAVGVFFGINPSQIETLLIGFSDRSLGHLLPAKSVLLGLSIRTKLEEIGLYKINGRETLRGFVTIPLFDKHGIITGIEGIRFSRSQKILERIVLGSGQRPQELRTASHDLDIATRDPVAEDVSLQKNPTLVAEDVSLQKNNSKVPTVNTVPITNTTPVVPIESRSSPQGSPLVTIEPHQITFNRGDRTYRVQGLDRNMSSLTLRVSIQASRFENVHLDTLDLVKARSRSAFIRAAAIELFVDEEIVKKDIGQLLLQLEDLRNRQIDAVKNKSHAKYELTEAEYHEAVEWLKLPNLTDRIVEDLQQCGMVGEAFNKLVAYLAVISRKLTQPLAILIQSSSSAGKTTLMDSILAMMPAEDQLRLSNMTSQSLYYLESSAIQHKTLAISEDHGINEAAYALKLLQSEGKLCHATVAKSPDGRMTTLSYQVEGPVQIFLTSTGVEIDEELVNRCLVLTVDESREQTQAIQHRQRLLQTRQGQVSLRCTHQIRTLHQNAQRCLRPLRVYNPFADRLSFASDRTRLRRDHGKYLTMIQSIALLHQYQRPIHLEEIAGESYESIEVLPQDIDLANTLMAEILGRSLDELSPQTRRCLMLLEEFVSDACHRQAIDRELVRFTRREFREAIQWSDFQVRIHFEKLVQMEYLLVHRGKQGRCFLYELLYNGQGQDGKPFLMGLATCER